VLLDVKLGADDGLDVLAKLLKLQPSLAVVMFTAYANIATAVEAMRRGAFDFLPKPFTPDQIRAELEKSKSAGRLRRESGCSRVSSPGSLPGGP
jgi:NtrC-family two-component system response regulator AlgB